jgi:MSHA type pilus biogenesis protein MshL
VATVSQQVANYKAVLGRQVLIEAQILDIELNDDFQYGIDWSHLKGNAAVAFGSNPLTLGAISTTVPDAINPGRSLTIPAQALGTAGTPQLGITYGTPTQSIAINMLKTFGAVHVLSNPSIRVKNTQPAVVSVGRNERYISQTTSNVSNSGGGQSTVSSNVITGNLFDGVMLGVIPFIGDDGTISLTINPVQTTVKPGSSDLINVGTDQNPQRISLPKVDFKGITTSLNMRSGDMVILGGLIDEAGNRAKSGLPGVAEVPVVGAAFGNVSRTARSRELIVVLRVRIL